MGILSFFLATPASADPILITGDGPKSALFRLAETPGRPCSLNLNYFVSDTEASDAAAGFGYTRTKAIWFKFHRSFPVRVSAMPEYYRSPWYIGAGPVIEITADRDEKRRHLSDAKFPFGIAFGLRNIALDPFIVVARDLELFGYSGFGIDGSVGIRYFF